MSRGSSVAAALLAAIAAAAAGNWAWHQRTAAPPSAVPTDAGAASVVSQAPAGDAGAPQQHPAEPPRRPIPEVLPDFSLATLDGPARRLSSFDQPSLVINFWATWCAPCRREIPLLKQIRAERASKGVEVVGIAVDFREDVVRYSQQVKFTYPILIGEQDGLDAANAFGLDLGLPFTIFSDAKRRIIAVKIGELHANEAAFVLDRVAEINAGELPVAVARQRVAQALQRFAEERDRAAPVASQRP